jgi:uncharacterized lipoprotein YddW (UPF0748 family)
MSNTYRALTPDGEAAFAEGVFEREFTAAEEHDWLASGLIELVPRTYRALSDNYTSAKRGEEFEAALLVEHEAALIQGSHIERVDKAEPEDEQDTKQPAKPAKKSPAPKKGQ